MSTVRYARTRIRQARIVLVRLDPHLARHRVWTLYGSTRGRYVRGGMCRYGRVGTGL